MNSNKFRMVYKVDGNPQLDSRDWSMYSNILKGPVKLMQWVKIAHSFLVCVRSVPIYHFKVKKILTCWINFTGPLYISYSQDFIALHNACNGFATTQGLFFNLTAVGSRDREPETTEAED